MWSLGAGGGWDGAGRRVIQHYQKPSAWTGRWMAQLANLQSRAARNAIGAARFSLSGVWIISKHTCATVWGEEQALTFLGKIPSRCLLTETSNLSDFEGLRCTDKAGMWCSASPHPPFSPTSYMAPTHRLHATLPTVEMCDVTMVWGNDIVQKDNQICIIFLGTALIKEVQNIFMWSTIGEHLFQIFFNPRKNLPEQEKANKLDFAMLIICSAHI